MKKLTAIIMLIILIITSTACNNTNEEEESFDIVASFYPVYIFTKNLVDSIDGVTVSNMSSQNTGCLHDYQLVAKDMKLLSDAELFVINGAEMESFLDKVISQLSTLEIVDSSKGIELICGHDHDEHIDEHDSEDEESTAHDIEHHHDHATNAHIWLSVDNAIKQVENISLALVEKLPKKAHQIESNKADYIKRLNSLKSEIEEEINPYKDVPIMTFHDAYVYFSRDYGLNVVANIESDEGGEPGARALAELADQIVREGVQALFVEPNYAGSAATILSNATNVSIGILNPLTSGEDSITAYEDIMRDNLASLIEAVK